MPNRKLIKVALPLDAINKASAREKPIRHSLTSTGTCLSEVSADCNERYLRRPFRREPDFGVTSVN